MLLNLVSLKNIYHFSKSKIAFCLLNLQSTCITTEIFNLSIKNATIVLYYLKVDFQKSIYMQLQCS